MGIKLIGIVLVAVASLAVIGSIVWLLDDPGWEPAVATLGALAALIGLGRFERSRAAQSDGQDPSSVNSSNSNQSADDAGDYSRFSGEIKVSTAYSRVYEVFYPQPFMRPPNLSINLGSFKIIEQRADGFKIEGHDFSSVVIWEAEGQLEK